MYSRESTQRYNQSPSLTFLLPPSVRGHGSVVELPGGVDSGHRRSFLFPLLFNQGQPGWACACAKWKLIDLRNLILKLLCTDTNFKTNSRWPRLSVTRSRRRPMDASSITRCQNCLLGKYWLRHVRPTGSLRHNVLFQLQRRKRTPTVQHRLQHVCFPDENCCSTFLVFQVRSYGAQLLRDRVHSVRRHDQPKPAIFLGVRQQ